MIKFIGSKDGRPLLGLGLSRGNCQKLLEGKPIIIDLKVLMMRMEELPDMTDSVILIFGGETEEAMSEDLEKWLVGLPEPSVDEQEN